MLNAVLVGCGAMSKGWLEALTDKPLRERVKVVGLVDLDLTAAERRKTEFSLADAQIGTDLDAMLAATKPDLLFDVAVPADRRDVVLTGFRHGCHVLTEKPMAASMAEAREILAAAKRAGRIHAVVQNRRFIPGVRRIRRLIARHDDGDVTAAARRLSRPIADVYQPERVIACGDSAAAVEFLADVVRTYDADVVWLITGANPRTASPSGVSTEARITIVEVLAELSEHLLDEARESRESRIKGSESLKPVSRGQSR